MDKAFLLARRAGKVTLPNPMVGAVIVKNGEVVGEGYHEKYGSDHAEAVALKMAGNSALGAKLFVSLEPCSHTGKTPPCTKAIIGSGIESVVYGMKDPNPAAAGGASELKKTGIEVYSVKEEIAKEQNKVWLHSLRSDKPLVILKVAVSKDEKLSRAKGCETSVSSKSSQIVSHKLRRDCDAVLVGAETVRIDDPLLTNRLSDGPSPIKVVLDSNLDLDPNRKVFSKTSIVACTELADSSRRDKFIKAGVGVIVTPADSPSNRVSIDRLLLELRQRGIYSLLVEGGAQVARSFLKTRNVDLFYYFKSPKVFGGDGPSLLEKGLFVDKENLGSFHLQLSKTRRSGTDTLHIYKKEG